MARDPYVGFRQIWGLVVIAFERALQTIEEWVVLASWKRHPGSVFWKG